MIFLAVMAIPVVASPCWACSCASSGDEAADRRAQARRADLIFYGVADRERIVDPSPGDGTSGDEIVYMRFRVRRTYKGHPGRWVTISEGSTGNSCRYNFREGQRYTVFAYKHDDRFHTDICSGTQRGNINPKDYGLNG